MIVTVPGNDNFANAFEISGSEGSTNANLFRASAESGEPAHAGFTAARSVWFKWTAPTNGNVHFDTIHSRVRIDTVLAVYTGTNIGSLSLVSSNNDAVASRSAPLSDLAFNASAGVTYHIAVDSKDTVPEASDAITLTWSLPTVPEFNVQPPEEKQILAGDLLVLTSSALGIPSPSYQWRFNSNNISGATFASYTNSSTQLTNDGYYDVIATNSAGSVTSSVSRVIVFTEATAIFEDFELASTNEFHVTINGINGYNYTVQATTDFITWTNVHTGTADFIFTNQITTNFPMRFFRNFY